LLNDVGGATHRTLLVDALYFSNGRPAEEVTGAHSTLFRARKETHFNPTDGQRVRSVVGSFAAHCHAEPAARLGTHE